MFVAAKSYEWNMCFKTRCYDDVKWTDTTVKWFNSPKIQELRFKQLENSRRVTRIENVDKPGSGWHRN